LLAIRDELKSTFHDLDDSRAGCLMLAQSFSCGESKDRNLCLAVAEDHARHNGTSLNIDRGSDVRKYEVCHWISLAVLPTDFHISILVGSGCR